MGVCVHWASISALMVEKIDGPSKFKDIDTQTWVVISQYKADIITHSTYALCDSHNLAACGMRHFFLVNAMSSEYSIRISMSSIHSLSDATAPSNNIVLHHK